MRRRLDPAQFGGPLGGGDHRPTRPLSQPLIRRVLINGIGGVTGHHPGQVHTAQCLEDGLHGNAQAASLSEKAANMTDDESERARLRLLAVGCLAKTARSDKAAELAGAVPAWYQEHADQHAETLAAIELASILLVKWDADKAVEVIYPVYERTEGREGETWARLAGVTSRSLMLDGRIESLAVADTAIPVMERLELVDLLLTALITALRPACRASAAATPRSPATCSWSSLRAVQ